jgi:hypothetical protein
MRNKALTVSFPFKKEVVTSLRNRKRYAGSIHDGETASKYGYSSALVPGDHLYGFMSQVAVDAWGLDWLERGVISSRSRRPAYDNQKLRLSTSALNREADGAKIAVEISDWNGEVIAIGSIGLPDVAIAPPSLKDFPVMPAPAERPKVHRGAMFAGQRLYTNSTEIDDERHRVALDEFQESWPKYSEERIVPAARLLRQALRDEVASYAYPTPSIFVSAATQHFGTARVGDVLTTSSILTDTSEHKGASYFECTTLVIANRTRVIAQIDRRTIYAAAVSIGSDRP